MNSENYKELIDQGGVLRIIVNDQLGLFPKGAFSLSLSLSDL